MPIKPENKDRYPEDWPQIRERIRQRACYQCEECGVRNNSLGGRTSKGKFLPALPIEEKLLRLVWPKPGDDAWCGEKGHTEQLRIIRIVCTVAHLDHMPEHCDDDNLKYLCQRCHLRYDLQHHKETAYQTRRAGKAQEMFP